MKPRWLYILLILALLLPAARPRLTGAMIAGSTPLQGASQGSNTTETEEEEVHERTATSRQTHRIAHGSCRSPGQYAIPQLGRFTSARHGTAPLIIAAHNGFGGNITC